VITFDPDQLESRRGELERETLAEGFWDDQRRAARTSAELHRTQAKLDTFERLSSEAAELDTMLEMAAEDADWRAELERALASLERDMRKLQEEALFTGEYDSGPAVVGVHAGAGGTDSQDWAEMLLRMYLRWAERDRYQTVVTDRLEGEGAGIKSVTFEVNGENAYGLLQSEVGVHRLVRISPFDANARRHTSFASVFVYPQIDEEIKIDIRPEDLRVDTFRASGAGGQHVNRTDSAVRITHLPSGIVVQCQNDRSQHRNRAEAMAMLKAKLFEAELRKRRAEQAKLEEQKTDIGWGHQIRSYVLDQSRIKDLRTNHEVGNTQAVLDGDLDDFIAASLKQGV